MKIFVEMCLMKEFNLIDSLNTLLEEKPDFDLYRFIDREGTSKVITPSELDFQAKKIAARLQEYKRDKKPVIILYEPGCEYIFALFGCLYAGAIPVPAYPPLNEEMALTLKKIIADSGAEILLTSRKINANLRKLKILSPLIPFLGSKIDPSVIDVSRQLNQLKIINSSQIPDAQRFGYLKPDIISSDVAYIQYTSGSVNAPKGVVITHANLMANLRQLIKVASFTEHDVYVSWLPPYHDMGLISGIFLPLFGQYKSILFSPITFLQKPASWLKIISEYKGTVSGGPNFAYRMLTNKVAMEDIAEVDLSSWRIAFCGAEPINPDTFTTFYDKFSCHALNPYIFTPCYGLAEAVLYVSGEPCLAKNYYKEFNEQQLLDKHVAELSTDAATAKKIISVGHCSDDAHIIIVDPESQKPLPDSYVGEIWFHGPNAARQYWNNSTESETQLNATLNQAEDKSSYRYVRTGDLGFKYNNELFITGRLKDLIIINGFNHYAADIEFSVSSNIKNVALGTVVAFSEKAEVTEDLIILAEIKNTPGDLSVLRQNIRALIVEKHFISPKSIFFVGAKTLPKTTSGKLKRFQCREHYINGKFNFL
ncbi:MAG: fatty acyl-AMP ligase [Legionella sp.]|uniref:fatty acyl-AMP ligase n=1 Tax=Legionella sp. TaxID=459 RepID=UPI00283E86BF|nr:fatty acyl-AMP ligase [Legionella sp.]